MTTRELEEVIYFDSYIVTKVDDSISDKVAYKQLLTPDKYYDKEKYGDKIEAEMGAQLLNLIEQTLLMKISTRTYVNYYQPGQKKLK